MKLRLRGTLREWSQMRRFNALDPRARAIVFYAEDAASWAHLGPLVCELTERMGHEICYLTSDPNDPILADPNERIHAFCIGDKAIRTALFLGLKADVCVMTMPDLETFHIKRSRYYPVHYIYVFHSMVSTHMIYRKQAFDHFDTVLCVGPHHVREIRRAEAKYNLKPKNLIEHGYGRLDTLLADKNVRITEHSADRRSQKHVLMAPSWGPDGLLENHGLTFTSILLDAGFYVTVRPHPMTVRQRPGLIRTLTDRFGSHPCFALETNVVGSASLRASDLMISDYSGAALEYAFIYERPVLFVDVPRKINNPDYEHIGCEPLEVGIRQQIGELIAPSDLPQAPAVIERVCANPSAWSQRIRRVCSETVFNVGRSASVGANHIAQLADKAIRAPSASEGVGCSPAKKLSLAHQTDSAPDPEKSNAHKPLELAWPHGQG